MAQGPIRAVISRSAWQRNLARLRDVAPNALMLAVIKANAYGHGLVATATALGAADLSCRWDEQQVIISISPRCRIKNVQPRAIAGRASTMAMSRRRRAVRDSRACADGNFRSMDLSDVGWLSSCVGTKYIKQTV